MRYKSFLLSQYKGIQDELRFSLDTSAKTPNCIMGNNESGKTTILRGIELIGRLCNNEELLNSERKAIRPKGDYWTGTVTLGAILECDSQDVEQIAGILKNENPKTISFKFHYKFENSSYVSNEIEVSVNDSPIEDEDQRNAIFECIKKQAPEILYYDDFKFHVPNKVRFQIGDGEHEDNDKDNIHWRNIFDDILKGVDSNAKPFREDVVNWSKNDNNDPSVADSRVRNMGRYLDRILSDWVQDRNYSVERFEISKKHNEEEEFSDYQISIIAGTNTYQMDERSKGLQWSFAFHILTKIRKNRHNKGFIFLLDEPANNLHVRPQMEMLKQITDLCDDSSSVIYSTHAPAMFNVDNNNFKNIYLAKNLSTELQATNITLLNLPEVKKDAQFQDLEPLFIKLAYEDFKKVVLKTSLNSKSNDALLKDVVDDKILKQLDEIKKDVKDVKKTLHFSSIIKFVASILSSPS